MPPILGPNLGFDKPTIRPKHKLGYLVMGSGAPRRKKTPSRLRAVIARNVKARAAIQFKGSPNVPVAIVNASGRDGDRLTKSHVQRIMAGDTSATLEQLEGLARALDLAPYQLLLEDLDAGNPQVSKGATIGEEQVYEISRKAAQEAVEAALSKRKVKSTG